MSRIAKNAIGLFVVQAASYPAPILVLPYLERYGVVALNVGIGAAQFGAA